MKDVQFSWDYDLGFSQLGVARDDSVRGIVHSVFPGEKMISLGPKAEALLHVIKPSQFDKIDSQNSIELLLRWRFAQPIRWTRDRSIRVWVRKRDFDAMVEGYIQPDDVDQEG